MIKLQENQPARKVTACKKAEVLPSLKPSAGRGKVRVGSALNIPLHFAFSVFEWTTAKHMWFIQHREAPDSAADTDRSLIPPAGQEEAWTSIS